jgi:hypothetical protein
VHHPNLEELLALRDGDVEASVADHVAGCDQCAGQVEALRETARGLRRLPKLEPPRDLWPAISGGMPRRRRPTGWLVAFAAAAAAVLVFVSVAQRWPTREPREAATDANPTAMVEELNSASRELEELLRNPVFQGQVLSARRAAVIVDLEDRIAMVDLALAAEARPGSDGRTVALWSQRVELLDALVTARGGLARDDDLVYAVFE